jgi:hypothetical protein
MIIAISGKIGSGKDTVGNIIQYLTGTFNNGSQKDNKICDVINYDEFSNRRKNHHYFKHSWEIKKFAGKLKQITAILTGCTVEELESQDFKNKELGEDWQYILNNNFKPVNIETFKDDEVFKGNPNRFIKKYTYRDLLQKIGTDCMRDIIHENVWVNALMVNYLPPHQSLDNKVEMYPNWIITDMRFPNELKAVKDRNGITIRLQKGLDTNEGHLSETALDLVKFDYIINNNGSIEDLIENVKEILILEKII